RVAGLEESQALNAIDNALAAQLVCAGDDHDSFDFTHALVRDALYAEMSPPRQARLHRLIAEAMEHTYCERADEHAGEIAQQYHRSKTLPGSEHGVVFAVAAAGEAESKAAFAEATKYLRIALEILPAIDPRRPRLLARLSLALVWSLSLAEAIE